MADSKRAEAEASEVLRFRKTLTFNNEIVENTEAEFPDLSNTAKTQEAAEQTEGHMKRVWKICPFQALPSWLQDNDYLHDGHRPELRSFRQCFQSIFRVHTETINIWTHLLGCIGFIMIAFYFGFTLSTKLKIADNMLFFLYFAGTITCLGLSCAFHTLHCHSEWVGRLFNKLDYCGIALLIMVSFVPWLYYGFYCYLVTKIVYTSIVFILGIMSVIVSFWEKFSKPELRPVRTAVFIVFGTSGVVPSFHYVFLEGWLDKVALTSLGWLSLMGSLYIIGAVFYAVRIPERFFPGKCDIWFQSHQIFHVFVIAAAFVHYYNISEMAHYRTKLGEC